jgi:hypothetical protein
MIKTLLALSILFPNKYNPGSGAVIDTVGADPASILNVGITL